MSIVSLHLLSTLDLYLDNAKALYKNSSIVLGGLPIVILLSNFFQFFLIIGRFLLEMPLSLHEKYRQYIWYYFTDVITLTKQMCQQGDIILQQLLKNARTGCLTQKGFDLLNNKIAEKLPISNNLSLVVIIQSNAKKILINCHRILKLAKKKSQDVYIFSASHIRSKTRNKNLVTSKKIFQVPDGGAITRLGLLFYTKSIPITILSNVYTSLGLVNRVRYISVSIVLDHDSIFNLRLVDNQDNNCSNLLSIKYKYNSI